LKKLQFTPQPTGIAKYELTRGIGQVMAGSMNFYRKEIVFNSKYIKSQFSFKFLRIVLKFLPLSFFIFMVFLKINNIIETDIQLLSLGFISFATGTFLYTLFSGKYFFDAILGTEIKVLT
jgi:hypothetical protein